MAITNTQIESTTTTRLFLSSGTQAITVIILCNTTSTSACEVDMYVVPSGGSPGIGNQILNKLSLPAKETFVFEQEKLILGNGDFISAKGDVDKIVTATVSSIDVS